ncbi:tRNA dimethylallyltransferase [Psychrobacter pacificensis]|uniref:tRNA dimethylallyltransferase n=1 Tax=Psychrobacter pacificensis TaxID=112002 RepID=A0A1G6XWK5_9GAMM|nr:MULTISPECIES: tRNA (adenosine(37)-N6)-dimethylallyltransferase MiaA [Psychrobacter]MED6315700.1 tRNA (adenosine(37)-N6)-dimethylallyltransferase MiaA [Pseudomonadota bacterium]GLR29893.1 tRNA dimethylallyltransferase [Psychrobacter pacificensis]SDD81785.1 tRNA dimethylallyltransferase [Psychrobacter pacificensis]
MQYSSDSVSTNLPDNSVVCLMAPTASGKTALAYELYDTGRFELISVDSALIYRDMNIGTAKPIADELTRYPHHLVDIIDPMQSYSVAEFIDDVARLIDECHERKKIPLLVGGTMMYYMALLDGLSPVPDSDDSVRARVEQWRQEEGISALYDYLGHVDSVSHQRLNATDTQRITRAIEVYLQTDRPISDWQREPKQALAHHPEQQWHALSVIPDRPWLHARIEQRLDIMWQEGLVAEVVGLLEKYPLTPNMPSMRCVGYRQVLEYLVRTQHPVLDKTHLDKAQFYEAFADSKSLMAINKMQGEGVYTNAQPDVSYAETEALACQEMQNKALYATRQLAKRQYTWLRKVAQLPDAASEFDDAVTKGMVLKNFTTMAQARDYLF